MRASGGEVEAAGDALRATRSLPQLYQMNGFLPLWDSRRLRALTDLLKDIEDDGLRASDYHLAPLQQLVARGGALGPLERATLDLLASDAYTLILYHLYFGKVDPVSLDSRWNFELREIGEADAVKFVHDAITQDRVRASVDQVRPDHWMYAAGRAALGRVSRHRGARRLAAGSGRRDAEAGHERPARAGAARAPRADRGTSRARRPRVSGSPPPSPLRPPPAPAIRCCSTRRSKRACVTSSTATC